MASTETIAVSTFDLTPLIQGMSPNDYFSLSVEGLGSLFFKAFVRRIYKNPWNSGQSSTIIAIIKSVRLKRSFTRMVTSRS
jgi:hypothetical protein